MRIVTTKGTITAPERIFGVFIEALEKAAEYEKEKSHLYDHDFYKKYAAELKELVNAGK